MHLGSGALKCFVQINMYCSKTGVIMMLVGNKIDKEAERDVSHAVFTPIRTGVAKGRPNEIF